MICCPGPTTSLPRGKLIVIWSLWIYLNSFSFSTNCYREWILNTITYFWCFLELFIGKFILNINNEHAHNYSCPGATFAFCSHGEKLPWQGRLPGVVQRVTRLSKLPRGKEKFMWTVTDVRPCTKTPGSVSCPRQWAVPRSCEQALKGCSPQVEVKSRKTKENGISHLRETALIHQTGEIFTSKPTFIQGVSEKLVKDNEHKSPPVHTFTWRFSIVWTGNQQCSVPHF